jgi:hypothetical protein
MELDQKAKLLIETLDPRMYKISHCDFTSLIIEYLTNKDYPKYMRNVGSLKKSGEIISYASDFVDALLFQENYIPDKVFVTYSTPQLIKNQEYKIHKNDCTVFSYENKNYVLWQNKDFIIPLFLTPYQPVRITTSNDASILPINGFIFGKTGKLQEFIFNNIHSIDILKNKFKFTRRKELLMSI